ncbi:unnamed protein product [marine sediment metagenome]|uniref:Uncharacterized protein n=1 Tax=marine sediment metagenome TaxID=412755 RepID=X1JIL9_9ZZZZ
MTISQRDLNYWYYHFKSLLSGWTPQEQIQFFEYIISKLKDHNPKEVSK